jgi:hydrogenase expression/formation protein HypE
MRIPLNIGKFPPNLLERLLAKTEIKDPRVIVGPRVGEDAAIIDMGQRLLVAKSDPITFATDLVGWYAVQVNANDVACTGGAPKWFLATLLVPESFSEVQAEAVFDQVLDACHALDITLIGGHSEVTYGIDRPIILGSMLGEVEPDRLVRTGGAQEGDSIVLTKGIAIEGAALLARERGDALRQAGVGQEIIHRASTFLTDTGISVVKDAAIACAAVQVHSLHDPTEGGLVTGLREVARASGLGLAVEEGSIPALPECQTICQALGLDPLGLLASGALLITLPSRDVPPLLAALEQEGISGWEIGQMIAPEEGLLMIGYEGEAPLPEFPRDELARYFSTSGVQETKG